MPQAFALRVKVLVSGSCSGGGWVVFPELSVPVHVGAVCDSSLASVWFVCRFCEGLFRGHVVGDQVESDIGWHRGLGHQGAPEFWLQAESCRAFFFGKSRVFKYLADLTPRVESPLPIPGLNRCLMHGEQPRTLPVWTPRQQWRLR